MKKTISFILAVCLVFGLTGGTAMAAASDFSSAQQLVQMLGIINGDENGNLNLSSNVTRAEFAKMMIAASTYKDSISSISNSSPFKDVKYTHWAASYIQTAVTAGWLTGYVDGTYRPDNNVVLEEAACAVLKMLGYTTADFAGAFPEAQLAKYTALGLNSGISKVQGQTLSRQDCVYLFNNLMTTKNKSGTYYAEMLGYTVNDSGEIDYSSLVKNNMKGPFIAESSSWASNLPFTATGAKVYLNGSSSSLSAVGTYDVYYYNAGLKTIWAYRNRITGTYTAATPSTSAPSSVTVAGNSYTLASSSAAYALSDLGSYHIGNTVTLLLGMNGDVVGVAEATAIDVDKYGIVLSTSTSSYTDMSGNQNSVHNIIVACTDGNTYTYEYSGYLINTGVPVHVTATGGETEITQLVEKSVSGTVNSAATTLGSYSFASDIEILDTTKNGSHVRVYPSRLAGMYVTASDVRYYVLDGSGKISRLILNSATNDAYTVGIVTAVPTISDSGMLSGSYSCIINGSETSYAASALIGNSQTGPALLEISGGSLVAIQNLTRVNLQSVQNTYATGSDGAKYTLAENTPVYISKDGSCSLSSLSAINTSDYTLSGYYDKPSSSGGRLRLIIAYPN